jgi:glycosyltransferase involved in cell wall biosynthesis
MANTDAGGSEAVGRRMMAKHESVAHTEAPQAGCFKILQTNFHLEWNGQVARIFLLSRELLQRGHRVVIAAPAGSALVERARSAGISVFTGVRFRKMNRPFSFARDVAALVTLIRTENFDWLHTHGSQDTWAVVSARRLFGLPQPILLTRHNTKPVRFHFFNRWLYRRGIDRLVVVSGGALENYRRFFDDGVLAASEVSVIHSSIDIERFSRAPSPTKIRAELGVAENTPLIGLVGRVSKDKGHEVLLEAMPQILRKFPEAVFVFAGKEGKTVGPIVRDVIRKKNLERSVRILGFREDIIDITAALDVSVLPAVGTDSSPAVLKEAILLGKPVVASRLAGLPEIVPEGAGILVTPGNVDELAQAIVATLRDREKRGERGGQLARQFTPDFMCEAYLRVYEEIRRETKKWD